MAETVTIEGRPYLKRNPLGVLGLSLITFGIYSLYWYWKINDELRTFEHDDSINPTRSLLAVFPGFLLVFVPVFIAFYNTAMHIRGVEDRRAIQPALEPGLVIVFLLFASIGNGVYMQEHLNRIWDRAAGAAPPGALPQSAAPPPPLPPTP